MSDTSPEAFREYCRLLSDLPAAERLRLGFAYSEFTRRLIREGLTAEGLGTDRLEFARRLYPGKLGPEGLEAMVESEVQLAMRPVAPSPLTAPSSTT